MSRTSVVYNIDIRTFSVPVKRDATTYRVTFKSLHYRVLLPIFVRNLIHARRSRMMCRRKIAALYKTFNFDTAPYYPNNDWFETFDFILKYRKFSLVYFGTIMSPITFFRDNFNPIILLNEPFADVIGGGGKRFVEFGPSKRIRICACKCTRLKETFRRERSYVIQKGWRKTRLCRLRNDRPSPV